MSNKGTFAGNAPTDSADAMSGSRRASSKLTDGAPMGSTAHVFGVPRRPQSVPPKPSLEAAHDTRLFFQERYALRRDSTTADAERPDACPQLFFVTDPSAAVQSSTPQAMRVLPGRGRAGLAGETDDRATQTSTLTTPHAATAGGGGGGSGVAAGATTNLYTSITQVLQARPLDFRQCTAPATLPAEIIAEESAGIFMGQLPSSYSEEDIECLLRALGRSHGKLVHVRDVKSHLRDRTCAFVMVNMSSVGPIIDFSKRVLCDINNVWVVTAAQASALLVYINTIPRQHLRGVPKLPLVLERLTHSGRSRRGSNSQTLPRETARTSEGGGSQTATPQLRLDASTQLTVNQMTQLMPMAAAASRRASVESTGSLQSFNSVSPSLHPFSMAAPPNSLYRTGMVPMAQPAMYGVPAGVPQTGAFPPMMAPPMMDTAPHVSQRPSLNSRVLSYGETAPRQSLSSYSHLSADAAEAPGPSGFNLAAPLSQFPMRKYGSTSGGVGEAGEMASLSTQSHGLSGPFLSSQLGDASLGSDPDPTKRGATGTSIPITSIPTSLTSITCSCGRFLQLSVMPTAAGCAQCQRGLEPNTISYWCPNGHLCVCTNCGVRIAFSGTYGMQPVDSNRAS